MRRAAALVLLAAAASAGPKENLPADCVILNHFDFDALRKTEVWGRIAKPIREFLAEAMGLEGLFEGIGFDPEKDLASVTFALGGDIARNEQQVYAIARGRFDAAKLAQALAPSGIKPVVRDGMTVFENKELQGKLYCGFNGAFGVVDGALLFADPAKGIDVLYAAMREGAERSTISKALEAAPDAHAWTVFLPTPALRKEIGKEPEGAPFAALTSGVVTFKAGPTVEVRATADAETDDLARQVAVVADAGLMGLGLKPYAKLGRKGATIEASLAIPLEDAMTMMGMAVESTEKPGTSARPVVAEGAPKLEGKGKLRRLALPGQVNGLAVSPDGTHVFVERALESAVVLDADLHVVGKARDTWGRMAFTLDGKAGLWPDLAGGGAEVRTIPDLDRTLGIERAEDRFDDPWAVCALPDGKTFVLPGWREVRLFHMDPPRWGLKGKAAIGRPIAGAVDSRTGLLVMIGDGDMFEVFDPAALKSVGTLTLAQPVTYDVAATGGRAWVGTKSGVILPVDIEARRVLDPVRVADGGNVSLALCRNTLVAAAGRFVDGDHHPTRIVAYEVAAAGLKEIAAATFMGPCAWNDVAVVPDRHTAILGGRESLVWTYAE